MINCLNSIIKIKICLNLRGALEYKYKRNKITKMNVYLVELLERSFLLNE